MILKNAKVMTENFELRICDVEFDDERIVKIGESLEGTESVDLTGKYLLPGFIDTHIHGAHGSRFDDPEPDIYNITEFEASKGITSVAATVAGGVEPICRQCDTAYEAHLAPKGAKVVAIHSEGPYISSARKGAMTARNMLQPNTEDLDKIIDHSHGLPMIISMAPELEGGLDLVRHAASRGVKVSMGHTDAKYDEAMAAIDAGASRMTHTFNASRPINHREPGVLGAVLTDDRVYCEMICDLVHLHGATLKLIYAAKGADKINMISDSSRVAGLDVSEFTVGGVTRYVVDGVIRLADGTIAGSTKTLLDGVKNLVKLGIPLEDVSKMASLSPAKSLGLDSDIGSIAVGKYADLVVLDDDFNVEYTFVNGKCVYRKD